MAESIIENDQKFPKSWKNITICIRVRFQSRRSSKAYQKESKSVRTVGKFLASKRYYKISDMNPVGEFLGRLTFEDYDNYLLITEIFSRMNNFSVDLHSTLNEEGGRSPRNSRVEDFFEKVRKTILESSSRERRWNRWLSKPVKFCECWW